MVAYFRMAAADAQRIDGILPPSIDANKRVLLQRVPRGVIGLITPWNWPYEMPAEVIAPALAAGNAVVWAAAPTTSLCAIKLAECLEAADLPAGLVNLITGHGPVVGDEIAGHAGVQTIAFIGSSAILSTPPPRSGRSTTSRPPQRKMDRHIADARRQGARVLHGGGRAPGYPTDLYYEPTVLDGVTFDMQVAREETFGPIIPIATIGHEDQALELIERSEYGLLSAIFTRDLRRALRFAEEARTGWVNVNERPTGGRFTCRSAAGPARAAALVVSAGASRSSP